MSSIVLQPGVKDMLLADCKDFLCSEEWYVISYGLTLGSGILHFCLESGMPNEVYLIPSPNEIPLMAVLGIPFRRGYLLHGVPGR